MNDKNIVKDLLYQDLAYRLVGCFYNVYNELGPGYKESVYHNALAEEFKIQKIPFEIQKKVAIEYKGKKVGFYSPDFLIDNKIVVEIKAVDCMPKLFETQLYYYLKGTLYKLGFIVNFGDLKIDIRRRIYDSARLKRR